MLFGSNIEEEAYGKGIDMISDHDSRSMISGRTEPPSRLSAMADMKAHLTCIPSVSLDRSITDVLPSQGKYYVRVRCRSRTGFDARRVEWLRSDAALRIESSAEHATFKALDKGHHCPSLAREEDMTANFHLHHTIIGSNDWGHTGCWGPRFSMAETGHR